ncbi:hypothetical protein TNCV_4445931 [Trichonephila clavipes]|nr:hypothetical protein TNCV_4445931 [Trichonephila clavipes]
MVRGPLAAGAPTCGSKKSSKDVNSSLKETATHIGIREAEDWFRPIDLAKECDIYISSRSGSHKEIPITYGNTQDPFKNRSQNFKPKIKENYPQYRERENKNCYICGDSSHCARDCEKRFKPKESNDHIHNRINVNTLKIESEKQNSDEFEQFQYVNIFVENQPVTALIDSGCQIPVLNSSIIRVNQPSEEIITLSSCFGEQRMVEVKPINISLNQLSRSKCSNGSAHAYAYPNVVSVSNVIENSSYDLSHVENFITRNDLSSLVKNYKSLAVETEGKRNRFEQTSRTLQRKISMRSTKDQLVKKAVLMPVKHNVFLWNLPDVEEVPSHDGETILLCLDGKGKKDVPLRTAYSQNGRCGMQPKAKHSLRAQAQLSETKTETMRTESVETFELVRENQNFEEREERTREVREQALPSAYHRQTYLLK